MPLVATIPLRVLILEDAPADVKLLVHSLRKAGYESSYQVVSTEAAYLAALQDEPEVILADYTLPDFTAPEALRHLRARKQDIPFIVVTGSVGEEVAVECMKEGAADYLLKDRLIRLGKSIERALEEKQLRDEKRRAQQEAEVEHEHLQSLFDEAPVSMCVVRGPDHIFEQTNPMYSRKLGRANVIGKPFKEVFPEFESQGLFKLLDEVFFTGKPLVLHEQQVLIDTQGNGALGEFYFTVSCHPYRQVDGSIDGVLIHAIDVTEQVISRRRIEKQAADLQDLNQELQRRLELLTALREIDTAISTNHNLYVTMTVFLEQLDRCLGVVAANVLRFRPESQTLTYLTSKGFRSSALQQTQLQLGEGQAGRVALTRESCHLTGEAFQKAFGKSQQLMGEGFVSYIAIPLLAKNQVQGVLELFHREPFSPSEDWSNVLGILATEAAIATNDASLFENLRRSNRQLTVAYNATIEGWARALDLKDHETEGHSRRVTVITVELARAMGMSEEELVQVQRGALLHDIGKMGIPDAVLLKAGKLTEGEWEIMKQHTTYARNLLAPISYLKPALEIPYCHHEKWDGSGYPQGLKGEQIPLAARIFAVVDVYDALTADRPYRKGWPREKILAYIKEQSGSHFDPKVVDAFLTLKIWGQRPQQKNTLMRMNHLFQFQPDHHHPG